MTEEQIKEMLNGIINNGEKWEYRALPYCRICYKEDCQALCAHKWQPYRLGDAIHDDYEYRKVQDSWLEGYLDINCDNKIEAHNSKIDIENVCKKILEEVKKSNNILGSIVYKDVEDIIKDLGVDL